MRKILIIEDNHLVRSTLDKILRGSGFEVVTAKDGVQGVAAFSREHPDLVITDIIMPEKEGLQTIREIRQEQSDAKIIAISGGGRVGNVDYLSKAQELGAIETIAKPFDPEELVERVKRCLAA